jgi:glycosyltransferase involved in cell wall biosynthesis
VSLSENRYLALYWGRRGGGESLFDLVLEMCEASNIEVLHSKRPTYLDADGVSFPISTLQFRKWISVRRDLVDQAVKADVKTVLIVMSSPWDLFLGKRLIKYGIDVVRVIHDATPHPGEVFPPRIWIKWLIKDSSRVITLSQYVSDQININYGISPTLLRATAFPIPKAKAKRNLEITQSSKILLIGRGKRYQGQELLEEAWKLVNIPSAELLITGEGFTKRKTLSGIKYKSEWMTHQELENEIATSKFVVLPYLEASQSGIIPICNALGVPVVVTPVGGLVEQINHGKNGIVAREVAAKALAEAIEAAWIFDWQTNYLAPHFSQEKFLQDCFLK